MESLLRIDGLEVSFGGLSALDAVSLSVRPGEVLGVIGPNGAGKTTLFNAVCGFVRPAAGTLHWQDRALSWPRPHQLARLGIARTLQGLGLFPRLTVLENVMVGATRHARAGFASALLGLPRSDRDERLLRHRSLAVLRELGAEDAAGRLPASSPTGCRSRSRWPGRWSASRGCCCSTSRPRGCPRTACANWARSSPGCANGWR